jgi:hypothetical protein
MCRCTGRSQNVTTATLFMGGNVGWNVPILGGEQMYFLPLRTAAFKRLDAAACDLIPVPGDLESSLGSTLK